MRISLIISIFILAIFAQDKRLNYQGMLFYEQSSKTNRVKSKENQYLFSFYSILEYGLLSKDEKWGLNFEAVANIKLKDSNYKTTTYKKKFSSNNSSSFLSISMASIDYYNQNFAISVGRNIIDLDYLSGSVDSILGIYLYESFQIRAFWFLNYYDFGYNYYIKYKNLNDNKGIGGIHIQSKNIIKDFEFRLYYYSALNTQYLVGVKFLKEFYSFNLEGSFAYSNGYKSESFLEFSIDKTLYNRHIFEIGYSKSSKDGLKDMLKFGSYPLNKFYLANSLDKDDAKNIYIKYSFDKDNYYINTIVGKTDYVKKYQKVQNTKYEKLNSYEIDLVAGYILRDNLLLEFGVIMLDSFEVDQNLLFLMLSMEF